MASLRKPKPLSMSPSVSASLKLSFYFHVPLLSQPFFFLCLSFFSFFLPLYQCADNVEQVAIIYWFLGLAGLHVTKRFKILLSFTHIVILVLPQKCFFQKSEICNYNM